jgi:hypothetical protein
METELSKAEKMIGDVESYVESAAWHSGRNLQALSEMLAVDAILNEIEQAGPTSPVLGYLEQLGTALNLRKRWLRLKDELPPNPYGFPLVTWHWKLLEGVPAESEKAEESQAQRIIIKARAQAALQAEENQTPPEPVAPSKSEAAPAPFSPAIPAANLSSRL